MSQQTEVERMFSMLQCSDGSNAAHHRFCREYLVGLGFNPDAPVGSIKRVAIAVEETQKRMHMLLTDPDGYSMYIDNLHITPEEEALIDKVAENLEKVFDARED